MHAPAPRTRYPLILGLLGGFWILNLAAAICFKESGTQAHPGLRIAFFLVGGALGLTSTIFQMRLYARMNVNLVLMLITCGSFVLSQLAFWSIYRSPLSPIQWLGVLTVLIGLTLATLPGPEEARP